MANLYSLPVLKINNNTKQHRPNLQFFFIVYNVIEMAIVE
jgi:hypothetical protein